MKQNERLPRGACPPLAIVVATLFFSVPAQAELIWDGNARQGTGVFAKIGTGNCEAPSTLTAVEDPARGTVFRYHKPSNSNRCENHGFTVAGNERIAENEETWYLGWWSKLSTTANNNANFQWKSYGDHEQNFPLVMKMINGQMTLMQRQPGGSEQFIWRQRIQQNEWNHYVLGIHVNNELVGGWVELWFNGTQQTFADGSTRFHGRTLDSGNHNCPKWGVYGGSGSEMTHWVGGLLIGTAYDDVKMGAPGGDGGSASGGASSTGGMAGDGGSGGSTAVGGSPAGTGALGSAGEASDSHSGGGPSAGNGGMTQDPVRGPAADDGCACRAVGRSPAHSGFLALGLLVALLRRRARIV